MKFGIAYANGIRGLPVDDKGNTLPLNPNTPQQIGPPKESATISTNPAYKEPDAASTQIKMQWMISTPTQELIKDLVSQQEELFKTVLQMAMANPFPNKPNYELIVTKLQLINQLQNILDKYGKQ